MRISWLAWLVFFGAQESLSAQWSPVKIEGREFITLESVAAFYGMPAPLVKGKHGGKMVYLSVGGGRSMRVKVDGREIILNGVRHWMNFSLQTLKGKPYVSRMDLSRVMEPAFRPSVVPGLPRVGTVVLDPGHGGREKGARSKYGYEGDYTLDLTKRVRTRLEKAGVKTVQTRLGDSHVPLADRPAMAKKYRDPIFVSLHFNSAGWKPSANGIEIYAFPPRGTASTGKSKIPRSLRADKGEKMEPASAVLANAIYPSMMAGTGLYDRGIKRARFAVLRYASVPAVLVEGGFLTNSKEAKQIASSAWRDKLADSIVRGILAYKALVETGAVPPGVAGYGGKETREFVPLK